MRRPPIPQSVQLEHLRAESARLEATLPTLEAELRARRQELKLEESERAQAEGEGLVAFLERLAGPKRALVARERAEAAAARLKMDKSRSALDSARSRMLDLRAKIERLGRVQQRVEQRVEELGAGPAARALQLELCEIDEAQAAVRRALECLDWMDESLRSAENWGVLDLFGGGMIATWVKHTRLDQAHERMAALQTALRRLAKELGDVRSGAPEIDRLDGFTRFADYFFEGFFVDLTVQQRITKSVQSVALVRGRLTRLRAELEARERLAREELALLPRG